MYMWNMVQKIAELGNAAARRGDLQGNFESVIALRATPMKGKRRWLPFW
jgi:hypothetical protein